MCGAASDVWYHHIHSVVIILVPHNILSFFIFILISKGLPGALLHILSQVRSAMSAAVTLQQCCRRVAAINVRQSIVRYMRDALTFKLLYIEYFNDILVGKAKKKKGLAGALLHILSQVRSAMSCAIAAPRPAPTKIKGESGALCTL